MRIRQAVLACCLVFAALGAHAAELKPEAVRAWEEYAAKVEQRLSGEEADLSQFLWIDRMVPAAREAALAKLQRGEVEVQRVGERAIRLPGALLHHWRGILFIPGVTLEQVIDLKHDYPSHSQIHRDLEEVRLLSKSEDSHQILLRIRKKKIITVVMNSYYDVKFHQMTPTHAVSWSRSTRIEELQDAGSATERPKPPGKEFGVLWRMNGYWRYVERDGGVYVQCETLSLTRDIPTGLGWLIGPMVTSIPRESLANTLSANRDVLLKRVAAQRGGNMGVAASAAND